MRFHFKKAALILSPFILICVVQIHFIPFRTHNVKNDSGDSTIHQWRTTLAKKQKTGNHRNSNSKKVIYRQPLNQRCQIPNLDPFHPDVMSFVSKSHMPPCRLKKYGRVDGRTLHLKIEGVRVQKVTLKYIIRSGDFSVRYSGPHTIVAHRDNDTTGKVSSSFIIGLTRNVLGFLRGFEKFSGIQTISLNICIYSLFISILDRSKNQTYLTESEKG